MNHETGPLTSFEEDVKVLGIGHLFEDGTIATAAPAKTAKTAAKTSKPAAPEQEVDVEDEETDEEVQSEDDDADEDDVDGDEDEDAEDAEDDGDEDEEDDAEESEESEEVDPDFAKIVEQDEKLAAAVEVVSAFYESLAEGEDETIDREALIGVVEAFEYVTEQFGLLDEMRKFRIRGGKKRRITRGAKKKAMSGHQGGIERMKYTGSGKKVRKTPAEIKAQKRASRFLGAGKAGKGGGAMRRARSQKKSKRLASDVDQTGSPLSELIQNINGLKEAVKGNVDYRRQAEELKEGFNSIGETASTWMESIASEVKKTKTEDKDYDPDQDPRVVMGRHLDGIAESAAAIIGKLDEGEADLEEASADLESLAADLKDAAEAMKEIE